MSRRTLVLVPIMLFGVAASTFAQATFSVGSIPTPTATAAGQTERTGDITFSQISGISNSGTINLHYGVPITGPLSHVLVTGTGGYGGLVSVNSAASSNTYGILVLNIPGGIGAGTITVAGVRVALAGMGLSELRTNVSTTGNAIVAGQTTVTVIFSVAPGLASAGAAPGVAGVISGSDGMVVVPTAVATAREGYIAAFVPQSPGTTTSTMVRFRVSANPPPGVRITFAPTDVSQAWITATSSGNVLGTAVVIHSASTNLSVYYRIATGTDPTMIETLAVPAVFEVNYSQAQFPLPATTITYACSLAPIGTAFTTDGSVISAPIPRFAPSEVGPATLLQIVAGPPPAQPISIDLKPEDPLNVINPGSKGVVPVAILTTGSFDASAVNPSTAFLGPTGVEAQALRAVIKDVNADGRLDMLLFFATDQTGILCGRTTVTLKAKTWQDVNLEGTDTIKTVPCPCFAPPDGLTGWWPGDGNTDDIVGGRNAVLLGDATTGRGLVDEAFILDGDGDFVDVPHYSALNFGTGDFTVALWVFFNETAGEQVLMEKYIQRFPDEPGDLGSEGWTLTKLEDNCLRLAMASPDGGEWNVDTPPLAIRSHRWVHFAATRSAGTITLFMNGEPVVVGDTLVNLASTSSLKFGHRGNPLDTPGSEDSSEFYLNGRIDEVQIFVGRALSVEQIRAVFEAGSAGMCKM